MGFRTGRCRTGGMQERRGSGLQYRNTGNEGCRKLGFKDAEQEESMTAWMQDRWDTGLE